MIVFEYIAIILILIIIYLLPCSIKSIEIKDEKIKYKEEYLKLNYEYNKDMSFYSLVLSVSLFIGTITIQEDSTFASWRYQYLFPLFIILFIISLYFEGQARRYKKRLEFLFLEKNLDPNKN